MAITSFAQLKGAARQIVSFVKNISNTTSANSYSDVFRVGPEPVGFGPSANTTSGQLITNSGFAGVPRLNTFGAGNKGYIAHVSGQAESGVNRYKLIDMLWYAGDYALAADVTLSGQPSIASRVPDGDYSTVSLWVNLTASVITNSTITITYTNQDGVGGRVSTIAAITAFDGVQLLFPLQSGDSGVQKVDRVQETGGTATGFAVYLARTLLTIGRVTPQEVPVTQSLVSAMPEIFQETALILLAANSVAILSGTRSMDLVIVNG